MTKIERTIVIDRPLDEVWEFVHDAANDPLWQTTLVESEPMDGPVAVGSQRKEVRRFLGKRVETVMEVTEWEPKSSSASKMVSGPPLPLDARYRFEPLNGGTRLTATGELDAHGFFKVAEPLFKRMAGRELGSSLAHLKDLLEG